MVFGAWPTGKAQPVILKINKENIPETLRKCNSALRHYYNTRHMYTTKY